MSRLPVPLPDRVVSRLPLSWLPQPPLRDLGSTWRDAKPARIARAYRAAAARSAGGWCVAGASTDLGRTRSIVRTLADREVVLWRETDGRLVAGPGACPHLGARLADCPVLDGTLRCRWHGMALGPRGDSVWQGYPAQDDGVLLWVRVPVPGEEPTAEPGLPPRPDLRRSVAAVIARLGVCRPADIITNRLDPWHGAWFHPYAFSNLTVDESASDEQTLVVDVAYRLNRRIGIAVRATFSCPDARTIVMRIIEGEGEGSVVETHATPLYRGTDGHPRTMMVEAVLATSERPGFGVARTLAPLVRPAMRRAAGRLWVDDLAYAERRYDVTTGADPIVPMF